jgi:hypothetical protein
MVRGLADIINVRGDPGIGADEAGAGHGIDIQADVVDSVSVVAQVCGLEDGNLGVAVVKLVVFCG